MNKGEAFLMKIAFSDFDGTLYFHNGDIIPQINIEAVNEWRSKGHIFVLCSGRDVHSLMHEVNNQELTYDFVICNNGGTIFDKNLKLIKSFPLDKIQLKKLVYSDIVKDSWHILFSSAEKMRTTINSPKSQLLKYFKSEKYKNQNIIQKISIEQALIEMNIIQISLAYETEEIANKYAKRINNEFEEAFFANMNLNCIDICSKGINKAQGVRTLLELQKDMTFEQVLTIGDAQNDVPMIKEFKGYSLNSATMHAKNVATKLYDSVGEMLLDNIM